MRLQNNDEKNEKLKMNIVNYQMNQLNIDIDY